MNGIAAQYMFWLAVAIFIVVMYIESIDLLKLLFEKMAQRRKYGKW